MNIQPKQVYSNHFFATKNGKRLVPLHTQVGSVMEEKQSVYELESRQDCQEN